MQRKFDAICSVGDFWKVLRSITNTGAIAIPPLITANDTYVYNNIEKANLLSAALANNFNDKDCSPLDLPTANIGNDLSFEEDLVADHLLSLQAKTRTGLDNIPARPLQHFADILAPPLTAIFNRIISDGDFPAAWKRARIVCLPKVSGSSAPSDCRGISIIPVLAKVFEKCLLSLLQPYLGVSRYQFGFCRGRSTEDAIAFVQKCIADGWLLCQEKKVASRVAVCSLDIHRAFDQVPHNKLLSILQIRGVPVPLLQVLKSYLAGREQLVRVGNSLSDPVTVKSGIGQGTILGPYLFNVYIDSLFRQSLSANCKMVMYADDCLLLKPISSLEDERQFQSDLDCIFAEYANIQDLQIR